MHCIHWIQYQVLPHLDTEQLHEETPELEPQNGRTQALFLCLKFLDLSYLIAWVAYYDY